MQLQRAAFEGAKLGTWRGTEDLVSVTAYGEMFGLPMEGIAGKKEQESGEEFSQYEASLKGQGEWR